MKTITKFYLIILIFFYATLFSQLFGALESTNGNAYREIIIQPKTWLQWFVNISGIFALISYAYTINMLSTRKWLVILILMLGLYSYQLVSLYYSVLNTPLYISRIMIILKYLLLVAPSVICTAYITFNTNQTK